MRSYIYLTKKTSSSTFIYELFSIKSSMISEVIEGHMSLPFLSKIYSLLKSNIIKTIYECYLLYDSSFRL